MKSNLQRLYARSVFYPTLTWNLLLGRSLRVRNWWDRIDAHVIVGAYPFASFVAAMHADGVRAVVNTCAEYQGPIRQYREYQIEQLRIPTIDFTHPALEDVCRGVEFIQRFADSGKTVYVHCKAGRARSATVAMCWLLKYREMNVDQAQAALLRARPHVNRRLGSRPVVQQFADQLMK